MNKDKARKFMKRITPKGVRVRWKRGFKLAPAHARRDLNEMLVPDPLKDWPREEDARRALAVYAHECGHFRQGHFNVDLPIHREEYEAEMWSITQMRMAGFRVPRITLYEAKKYVRDEIAADRRKGVEIERHIEHWASTKSGRRKVRAGEPERPVREAAGGEPDQAQAV